VKAAWVRSTTSKLTAAIQTQGLTKDHGSGRGLFDLDLEVAEVEVFGYLGPNGAGKSTTIRLLMGFIHATRGSASILGLDSMRESVEVKRLVGYVPGELQEFFKLVLEAQAAGATVFLSSHVLSEVEHVCQRMGIIRHGKLVKVARLDELHEEMHVRRVEVEFAGDAQPQLFRALPGVENLDSNHHRVTFTVRGSFEPVADVLAGHHVVNLASHEPTLEEMFLTYYEDAPEEARA
jgi:ABC-type multidrug transport system ATPase subunit